MYSLDVRSFKDEWEAHSKNEVSVGQTKKGEAVVSCYLQADTLIIFLAVILGKRGGIRELLRVADLGITRIQEQLIINRCTYYSRRTARSQLLNLQVLRGEILYNDTPTWVCKKELSAFVERVTASPAELATRVRELR